MLMSGKYPRYNLGPVFGNYPITMRPALVGVPPKAYHQQGAAIKIDYLEPGMSHMVEEITKARDQHVW